MGKIKYSYLKFTRISINKLVYSFQINLNVFKFFHFYNKKYLNVFLKYKIIEEVVHTR